VAFDLSLMLGRLGIFDNMEQPTREETNPSNQQPFVILTNGTKQSLNVGRVAVALCACSRW
jgi:hypothetical protein